jgi:hypothetical protein
MKVACITDDGKTISAHFGRARHYAVLTVEDGRIVARELRDKLGHGQFAPQEEHGHDHGAAHGTDPASHDRHVRMAEESAIARPCCAGAWPWRLPQHATSGRDPGGHGRDGYRSRRPGLRGRHIADHPEMLH